MNRADRLNERFKLIQTTVAELYGADVAFAAAAAAWLMAVQYGVRASMRRIFLEIEDLQGSEGLNSDISGPLIEELDAEHELMLRGFHKELCAHLGISPAIAERHAKAFKQVVEDICNQGG